MNLVKAFVFILLTSLGYSTFGQTTKGTDFWLNFLNNLVSEDMYVIVSADDGATVTIDLPGQNASTTLNLNPGELRRHLVSSTFGTQTADTLLRTAIHVTSDKNISVYANSIGAASSDATCVLPTQSIPPKPSFIINQLDSNGVTSAAQNNVFSIVPHDSNTLVQIIPRATTTAGWAANVPYTITLHKGDVYIVRSQNNLGLEGSEVTVLGNKKVSVFQGNDCIRVDCGACDHLFEVVLPNKVLGKNYVLMPFYEAGNGYRYSITSSKNDCIIYGNGVPKDTIDRGEIFSENFLDDSSICITTTQPVSITQTMKGCNPSYTGDPATVAILPLEQSIDKAIVSTANTTLIQDHFINVLVPKTGIQRFFLDGNKVPQAKFTQVFCGDFYYYSDTVSPGNHSIECQDGFLSTIYGMGGYETYAYFAGASLRNLELSFEYETVPNCDTGILVRFSPIPDTLSRYRWKFPPNATVDNDTFKNPVVYFPQNGNYPVQLFAYTPENGWDSITLDAEIVDTTAKDFITFRDQIICADSFTFDLPGAAAYDFSWNTGDTGSKLTITKGGTYIVTGQNKFTNCSITDTADVTMYNKVDVDFGFYMERFCPGYPLELYDSTKVSNDTIAKWEWIADFQLFSTLPNDTIKSPRANNYDIRLRVTTNKGCVDSLEKRVEVDDNPRARMSLILKDSCVGRGLTQGQNSSTILLGKFKRFVWEYSTGDTVSGTNAPIKEFKDTGKYWARIWAESEGGCVDTSDRFNFTIYSAPKPKASLIDSAICEDNNYFLFDNETISNEPVFYEWQWGDGSGSVLESPTAKVYADTGTYELNLVAGFASTGCTDTFQRNVRVFEKPKADVTQNSREECLNNNFFDYSDNSDAKGAPSRLHEWIWSDGTRDSGMSNIRKSFANDGAYTLNYVFSSGKGCSDTIQKRQNVYKSPTAKFVLDSVQLCESNNKLIAIDSSEGPANKRYSWNFGNGNTYSISNPPIQNYSDSGEYTIQLVLLDPLVLCRDTFEETIKILKDPESLPAVDNATQCIIGNSFNFSHNSLQNNTGLEFKWTFNDLDETTGESINKTFTKAGTYRVKLAVNNGPQCQDTASILVTVGDTSITDINLSFAESCITNNELTAEAILVNGPGLNSFAWKNWSETSAQIVKNLPTGTNSIEAYTTNIYGCKDTVSKIVTIWPQPEFTISNSAADNQCLFNNQYQFEVNTNMGQAPFTFDWLVNNLNLSSGPNLNYTYPNAVQDDIEVITTDAKGCKDTMNYSVEVFEQAEVSFSADSICPGESFNISAQTTPSNIPNLNYNWILDGTPSGTGNTFNFTPAEKDRTYNLQVMVNTDNGCGDTSSVEQIMVHDSPTARFNFTALEPRTGAIPYEFRDSSIGASRMEWNIENKIFTDKNTIYNFSNVGNQTITLTVYNQEGCSDSVQQNILVESPSRFYIPSAFTPNNDGLNDDFGPEFLAPLKEYSFKIYNRWGELIFQTEDPTQRWDASYQGEMVMDGEYMFMVHLLFQNGERLTERGQVSVLR